MPIHNVWYKKKSKNTQLMENWMNFMCEGIELLFQWPNSGDGRLLETPQMGVYNNTQFW